MVQVEEMAQQRIARAREEGSGGRAERDESSLMQASMTTKPAEAGISTYGLELQFLTNKFSALDVATARVRSSLLRVGQALWMWRRANGDGNACNVAGGGGGCVR